MNNRRQFLKKTALLLGGLALTTNKVFALNTTSFGGTEPYLGEIGIFSFGFEPQGWAQCNGQLLAVQQNQALFSLLGTRYSGNGVTTFGLPDLRGRAPLHVGTLNGNSYSQGTNGGAETHLLIPQEIPAHVHRGNNLKQTKGDPTKLTTDPKGNYLVDNPNLKDNLYATSYDEEMELVGTTTPSGVSQSHYNMQPYLVLNFCIALTGIYPSRD